MARWHDFLFVLQWHFQVKEISTTLCQNPGEHFPSPVWGYSQSTKAQGNTCILKICKYLHDWLTWDKQYRQVWTTSIHTDDWLVHGFIICCPLGDRVWQCGWRVKTQWPHVLLQKPEAWGVDHRRQPTLHILPVLHVRQHHGAKQPSQVSLTCLHMQTFRVDLCLLHTWSTCCRSLANMFTLIPEKTCDICSKAKMKTGEIYYII